MPDLIEESRFKAFSGLADKHPVWIELCGLLAEIKENATIQVAQCDLEDNQRAWQAGYIQCAIDLQSSLDVYHKNIRT